MHASGAPAAYRLLDAADDGQGIAPAVLAAGAAPGHWGLRGLRVPAAQAYEG